MHKIKQNKGLWFFVCFSVLRHGAVRENPPLLGTTWIFSLPTHSFIHRWILQARNPGNYRFPKCAGRTERLHAPFMAGYKHWSSLILRNLHLAFYISPLILQFYNAEIWGSGTNLYKARPIQGLETPCLGSLGWIQSKIERNRAQNR